jgi:DNA-binding response OmpR family regulator
METDDAPTTVHDDLTQQERLALDLLLAGNGRVVGRIELTRALGIPSMQSRRVDVVLVQVRKVIGEDRLVNVRNRGWRIVPPTVSTEPSEPHGASRSV